jgi:hypothetical protein
MRGVYLVAAELSRLGLIVSPTSRSAHGADLLVTDQSCNQAFSVQVKANATTFGFWLLNKKAKELSSRSHIYVFVNLRGDGNNPEYYIVPSKVVSKKMYIEEGAKSNWYSFSRKEAMPYLNKWKIFQPTSETL